MPRRLLPTFTTLVVARAALPLLLLHPAWGFHIDEFLYAALGDHLSLLHNGFPPLVPAVTRLGILAFGTDVLSARVPAALAGAALVAVAMLIAARLGGGRWALVLTALAMSVAPVFLRTSVLLHPVVFDQLWYAVAALGITDVALGERRRGWLLVGLGLGLGALTKFSVAVYALGVVVATLATPLRAELRTRWPWIAAAVAAGLALPSLAGQVANGWPFLAQMRVLAENQLARVTPAAFLGEQPLMLGPAVLLVGFGAWATLQRTRRAVLVPAGIAAATILMFFLVRHGKAYYAAPIYPPLIAAGAVHVERLGAESARWLRPTLAGAMAAFGVVLLPIGIPLLGPEAMAGYATRLGLAAATRTNRGVALGLPQDYADMMEWDRLIDSVEAVVRRLPPEDQQRVTIIGNSYGQAGSVARLGVPRGLPYPVSPKSEFHAWGPGDPTHDVYVVLGDDVDGLRRFCHDVTVGARLDAGWNLTGEIGEMVLVCRHPKQPLAEIWAQLGPGWG